MDRSEWDKIFEGEIPHRTIRLISLTGNVTKHNGMGYYFPSMAYTLFKQYGEIESTRYGRDEGVDFILVQFKNATAINDLIKKGEIELNDHKFAIKPFHDVFHLIHFELFKCIEGLKNLNITHPPPPVDSHENIMQALNDDCLGLIFEKIGCLADIYSVTNVCKRFKSIGKVIFPSIIKRKYLRFDELIREGDVTFFDIKQFLRDFGASVKGLECCEHRLNSIPDASNNILKIAQKYCKNLQSLSLKITISNGIEYQTITEIRSLLSKLKDLDYYGPPFYSFYDFISACTQVETMKIGGNYIVLPEINFPKLVQFECGDPGILIDAFLEHNSQIEKLSIPYSSNACRLISNMPNIRKLTFEDSESFTETDSIYLKYLKHLEITMDANMTESIKNIFPMKNITKICLTADINFENSVLIKLMQNLYNLKELEIFHKENCERIISIDLLKEMIQYANKLSEIDIVWPRNSIYHFDDKDYYDILKIVKNRVNPIKLNIEIAANTILFHNWELDSTGHKKKMIPFDMVPDCLTVTQVYQYDFWKY